MRPAVGRSSSTSTGPSPRTFTTSPTGSRRVGNWASGGSLISSFNYSYDNLVNRTGVVEGAGGKVSWTYDTTYQLINECRTVTYPYCTTYVFDPVGNRLVLNANGAVDHVRLRCGEPTPDESGFRRRHDLHVRCQREPANRAGPERPIHDKHVGFREPDDARPASHGGAGHHGV